MRRILVVVAVLAISGCGGKKSEDKGAAGSNAAAKPMTCPPGNVVQSGACVEVVTPEKIAVVVQQQSRLDDLAKLLDQAEVVAAPIELLDGFRQLPQWKDLSEKSSKLQIVDTTVKTLNDALKQLRTLRGHLDEASQRLGNLKGELDKLMTDSGAAKQIEDVRVKISKQLRDAIEPLARDLQEAITNAITPLATQLADMADLVIGACAMAKLSGAGDKMNEMCEGAKAIFEKGRAYVTDFKTKPAALFTEVSDKLESELGILVDDITKRALDTAQATVNEALRLPAGSGTP